MDVLILSRQYVISLDQGTTSSRAILFDHDANMIAVSQQEFNQYYPHSGWVEHDPNEIWESQRDVLLRLMEQQRLTAADIAAIGITNQRETTIVWDRHTGEPIYNAIVWQCRRSHGICQRLKEDGLEAYVKQHTGLVLDPYFSATKIKWLLDNVDGARERADRGDLLFGTIDTWLTWKLSDGAQHVTDPTNASRTMLFNIHNQQWDTHLLAVLNIPISMLPKVLPSCGVFGETMLLGSAVHIAGIAGDQQAALFGQLCIEPGMAKNTYGTGCFLLMNTGTHAVQSSHGLLTTIAIGVNGEVNYALEGSVFMAGATVQWLRDELGLIATAEESAQLAQQVADTDGVYVVPAFVGLGAPYWDADARGAIIGLSRGSNRQHIVRAALESIAYQSRDVLEAMIKDSRVNVTKLKVDGGAVGNDFLMQFQADISGVPVWRPLQHETTALGAAFLAGLAVGFWESTNEITNKVRVDLLFEPNISDKQRDQLYKGWQQAVGRTRSHSDREASEA